MTDTPNETPNEEIENPPTEEQTSETPAEESRSGTGQGEGEAELSEGPPESESSPIEQVDGSEVHTDPAPALDLPSRPSGRVGPHRESHEDRLNATKFELPGVEIPTEYVEWDGSHGIENWGMDENGPDPDNPPAYPNGMGCCGPAAFDHGNVAKANDVSLIGSVGKPKFNGISGTYWAYGIAQGETGTPPAPADEPDEGVDNATLLGWAYKEGLIYGYGEAPLANLDYYAQKGNGLLVGLVLDDGDQQNFENHIPWGQGDENPDTQLGHDTWLIKTHADGAIALISWAAITETTPEFREKNLTDAWIIYDEDDPTIDHDALQAALAEVHGTVEPVPPADPTPTPIPPNASPWLHRIEEEALKVADEVKDVAEDVIRDVKGGIFGRNGGDVSEPPAPRS